MISLNFDGNKDKLEQTLKYFSSAEGATEVNKGDKLEKIEGNIYAIYVDGKIKYIGERQSGKIAYRLNQHFFSCPPGTSSKLSKVTEAFDQNKKVAYKTLLVVPDYERYSVETYLIQNIAGLDWNIRDKKHEIEISGTDEISIIVDSSDN